MKKLLGIMALLTMTSGFAHAELVGSLHIDTSQDFTNEISAVGFTTRITNGTPVTRGTIAGEWSFLAGADVSAYTNTATPLPLIKTFSDTTQLINFDRFGNPSTKAIAVWDFDLSGIVSNAWELKVDFSDRDFLERDEWYISFNGLGRTLDTTVVTNLTPGTGHLLAADHTKYVKIGELPAGSDPEGTYTWDLTPIVEAAQANDGLVRLVYAIAGFRDGITFTNDSGLIATDVTSATEVEIPCFYVLDDFETGTAAATNGVVLNGWSTAGNGPEWKEYNVDSSGILDVRDALVTPLDGTNAVHAGQFDGVQIQFHGVELANVGDWLEVSADIGCYEDESGALIFDCKNPMANMTLVDSSATTNAGYGFYIRRRMLEFGKLNVFDTALGFPQFDVSGSQSTREMATTNGTLQTWSLRIERIEGDNFALTPIFNGKLFGPNNDPLIAATNNACIDSIFDTLTFHVRGNDIGMKIDNVVLVSNVKTEYQKWVSSFGLFGTDAAYTADPDVDLYNNAHEWGLGGDPTNGLVQGIAPVFGPAGSTVFRYTYPSNTLADELNYSIETTDDLVSGVWTNRDNVVGIGSPHSENASFAAVTNELSTAGKDQEFIKLNVELIIP